MDDATITNTPRGWIHAGMVVGIYAGIGVGIVATLVLHFRFVFRKVLLFLGFPKLETHHPELGVYQVGALQVRLSPDLPTVQMFYPVDGTKTTTTKTTKPGFVSYYRPQAVRGVIRFLGKVGEKVDGIIQLLQEAPHPLMDYYGADPIHKTTRNNNDSNDDGNNNNNDNNNDDKQELFPLVIFSHGLGGTIEGYTELCSQMASLGCLVVAPEYTDTSAAYSTRIGRTTKRVEEIWYQPPPILEPYSRQKMIRYRGPHAEARVDELTKLYEALKRSCNNNKSSNSNSNDHSNNHSSNSNNHSNNNETTKTTATVDDNGTYNAHDNDDDDEWSLSVAHAVLETVDPSRLHLVGHSFGAATILLAAQRWALERNAKNKTSMKSNASIKTNTSMVKSKNPIVPLSITALDTWNFPLSDEIISRGIPAVLDDDNSNFNTTTTTASSSQPPILSIISEDWVTNPELKPLFDFLRNCNNNNSAQQQQQQQLSVVDSYYAKDSVHMSFSDGEACFPTVMARFFEARGQKEDRHATIRAVVSAFAKHAGIGDGGGEPNNNNTAAAAASIEALVPFPIHRLMD